ncbi:hypothetical protein LOAG_05161 [Loa loa]|uniref:Uncharacterized protein n=1 Tax=Loa loa TaxID=7209 RepID=A0A1S0U2E7_LOALO|nr:hypothetical protein LOAG_05161 [Loa loa]EFO23323.1 hypothetical protein LOAG_05161 [Loa loa]
MYVPPLLLKFTVLQITQDVEPSPALLCTCKFRPHSKRPLYLAIGYFAQMHGTEPLMRSERREYYVVDVVCEYAVLVFSGRWGLRCVCVECLDLEIAAVSLGYPCSAFSNSRHGTTAGK